MPTGIQERATSSVQTASDLAPAIKEATLKRRQAADKIGFIVTANELKKRVKEAAAKRQILQEYIEQNLKPNVDFGVLAGTKPSLFKSGSEKFCSLMHLTPRFRQDKETWAMSGSRSGLFCFVCELVDESGRVVAEGRGARDLNDQKTNRQAGDINASIKMAQKSAQIDAVLRAGMLSDMFTQDLEDMIPAAPVEKRPSTPAARPEEVEAAEPCPECGRKMTLKQASTGSQFWGCTGYAIGACRKTLPLPHNRARVVEVSGEEAPF